MLKNMSEIKSATARSDQPQSCATAPTACGCCSCGTTTQPSTLAPVSGQSLHRATYTIENMDCPTEEALVRKKLEGMPGIDRLEFNLMQRMLTVHHSLDSLDEVERGLTSVGMQAEPLLEGRSILSLFSVAGMCCPTEVGMIRAKLAPIDGITGLDFNLIQRTLKIVHEPEALPLITAALESLDMGASLLDTESSVSAPPSAPVNWHRLGIAGAAAVASEAVELASGNTMIVLALALAAILIGGLSTYKKGWIALKNLNLNMNALMSFAVTGALLIGQWPEAAMVMVLFTLAEVIEARSLDRARNAIRGLMELAPDKATVQQPDNTWTDVDAKLVAVGSRVRVKPGERIALDGEIVEGHSAVNQAPITGESLPVEKMEGDAVFAGTINESGSFIYQVTAGANDSTLARIIHAVEEAQGSRAPTQRFVDQFARYYTPGVFVLALAVALVPPLASGAPWMDWIYRALVLLVIACPCALVISTPVSIVSGLAAAARKGILIKGGVYLEDGRKLRWLALDKTGTLTHGKPVQTDFISWGEAAPANTRPLAASLAARSDHPVSKALAMAAIRDNVAAQEVDNFAALPGRGVQGSVGAEVYYLVNHRMIDELGLCSPELEARLSDLEKQGKSVVLLANAKQVLAIFAVADTVKETSRQAVSELHALGVQTVMLTGDNSHTAGTIAAQVGTSRAHGGLLPEDKLQKIEELVSTGTKVGMVGDGINDAPALARADIGFAMGAAGADTAIETADVALMDDDLRKIPAFIRLSRATSSVLKQNIGLALGIKAVFVALTFAGQATLWMAVFADMGTSLLVVFNGLRLLRK